MRTLVAAAVVASLVATPVFAGDAPLPAGRPAGVAAAQYGDNSILYIIAGGAIIAGIVLIATNGNSTLATAPVAPASTTTT
jgi:hypothetical protein